MAAGLMLFSGLSYPCQLLIYGADDSQMLMPALLGAIFLFGLDAAFRILTQDPNIMSYMLAAVDFVVVTLCVEALCMPAAETGGGGYSSNRCMRSR